MKFRKRMEPIVKFFAGLPYEATDWYRTKAGAEQRKAFLENTGFVVIVKFEDWWPGWFIYTGSPEHRKITAIRRKGPGKKGRRPKKLHPAESIARNVMPGPIVSGPEQVIAEIVAKDIEDLCIGNTP